MNPTLPDSFVPELLKDLNIYARLCEEILSLTGSENQALGSGEIYEPLQFNRGRKDLIARLEQSQNALRHWRQIWQQVAPDERVRYTEVNDLFQTVQDLVVRILMLDRENQQSLLRRGLLPPQGLPSFAGQKPNFVSSLYRRHAVS